MVVLLPLFAAALALLLAGCVRAGPETSAPSGRTSAKLVFTGLAGEPDTLDPLVSSSADARNLSHLYLSRLLESDARGELVPDIATLVPSRQNGGISADGRTIVYHLRRGVRWQDGAPLGARDVVFTYRAVMNAANNVVSRIGYEQVAAIETPDDSTVVRRLRRPFAPILAEFCGPASYAIVPEHLLGKQPNLNHAAYNGQPVGSGPYRVVRWERGDFIEFAANPSYWRGIPHIARLVYRITPDANTRLAQLASGEADAYFVADPQLLPQLRALPGVRVNFTPVNDMHVLTFNLNDPVAGDLRFRKAVAHAVDRAKLIAVATHGSGLALDGDQPRNGWAHSVGGPPIGYDPAASKRLLDAAGWRLTVSGSRQKEGRPLDIVLVISPQAVNGSAAVATLVQRYLHDVGIAVTIKQFTVGQMYGPRAAGGILQSGRYQLAYAAWWVQGPDPDDGWQFACDQRPPGGENWSSWCNVRADAAIADARRSFDQQRRRRDYAVVQAELRHDLPELTLWQVNMPDAYRDGLRGFAPSPFGSTFWNVWNWRH